MNEAAWVGLGGLLVAVISAAVGGFLKVTGALHQQRHKDRGSTIDEFREICDRQARELEDKQIQLTKALQQRDEALDRLTLCYQTKARLEEWVFNYEDLLAANNVPHRPYTPRSGDSAGVMDQQI